MSLLDASAAAANDPDGELFHATLVEVVRCERRAARTEGALAALGGVLVLVAALLLLLGGVG